MLEPSSINLSVIQSEDPQAVSIIQTAKNVAHYKFVNNEWVETNIKGALFIYKRSKSPDTSLFILNRLRVMNLIQPLTNDLEFELKEPYIFYKVKVKENDEIYGIWFSNATECQCIYLLLKMYTDEKFNLSPNNIVEVNFNGTKNTKSKQKHVPINLENLLFDQDHKQKNGKKIINITDKIFQDTNSIEKPSLNNISHSLFKPIPILPMLNSTNNDAKPTVLEKEKFQKTLIHLLKNDKSFLDKIYETYLNI